MNVEMTMTVAKVMADIKRWVEETTGVPTLSLEMDVYDSRNYSASALGTRVEAFAEMLRARKTA